MSTTPSKLTDTPRTYSLAKRVAGPNPWSPHDYIAVAYEDVQEMERDLVAAQTVIRQMREQIEVLRLYGNKDCTAMADDELARRAKDTQ